MPASPTPQTIAIIGAGMSGLAAANALVAAGHKVELFDKGRGPGGRMSTRRMTDDNGTERHFDHGAQYFTARDPHFAKQSEEWAAQTIIAPWPEAGADAWVGVPGMNAPIRAMANAHDVHWAKRIASIARHDDGWMMTTEKGRNHGPFAIVIIAVPAEQVAPLVAEHNIDFANKASDIESAPCWTVMLGFEAALDTEIQTIRDHGPIGWAARNNAKPGRQDTENWVIQANPKWSQQYLEEDKEVIAGMMREALTSAIGLSKLPDPIIAAAHRWRYAMVPQVERSDTPFLWDNDRQLGLCGDWLSGPRIENAWLSGHLLGQAIGENVG